MGLITATSATVGTVGVVSVLSRLMQLKVMVNVLSRCCNHNTKLTSDKDWVNNEAVEMWQLPRQSTGLSNIEPQIPTMMDVISH